MIRFTKERVIRSILAVWLALVLVVSLTGCGSDRPASAANPKKDGQERTADAKEAKPAYGDMIIQGSIGDATVLLPVLANDSASFDITSMIYNGLVKYDKDLKLVGSLAERWEISEDNLRIRFFLRNDVKWQDGTPFTARDVKYTYEVTVDPNTPTSYATDFLRVKKKDGFRILDDYTVEVEYEKPYAPALGSWGQDMLPAHLLEGEDITKSPLKRMPVGTGPYQFKQWTTQEKIIVDAYPDYYD